jgi:DNA/RNA endonuclease G (NUC1)
MISHGVKTPDRFWKIILFADDEVQAWLMPNTNKPIKAQIDRYLVAPAEIENITGYRFADIPADQKIEKDTASKRRTQNCNYS